MPPSSALYGPWRSSRVRGGHHWPSRLDTTVGILGPLTDVSTIQVASPAGLCGPPYPPCPALPTPKPGRASISSLHRAEARSLISGSVSGATPAPRTRGGASIGAPPIGLGRVVRLFEGAVDETRCSGPPWTGYQIEHPQARFGSLMHRASPARGRSSLGRSDAAMHRASPAHERLDLGSVWIAGAPCISGEQASGPEADPTRRCTVHHRHAEGQT